MAGARRLNLGGEVTPTPTTTAIPQAAFPTVTESHPVPALNKQPSAPPVNIPELQGATTAKAPITIEQISDYGSEAQKQIASVTTKVTSVAKTSEIDEMGKLLTDTIMAAKGYDPNNLFKGGLFGFFKAKTNQISMKFDSVDQTVERLVKEVDLKIAHFRNRVQDLEGLRVSNEQYHAELTPQIERVKAIAVWMDDNQPTINPSDPMSGQHLQDWNTVAAYAHKRADDLRRAQILAEQQAAQIQQMKLNSSALAQKFADIKVTTIPAMKTTFTLYVINMEQAKGAALATQIDDTTNAAIMKNAELLGKNTTAIHTSLTRSNISMESLQANYQSITSSLDEVKRIQAEMKTRLATEAPQLEKLSQDLTLRLGQR